MLFFRMIILLEILIAYNKIPAEAQERKTVRDTVERERAGNQ